MKNFDFINYMEDIATNLKEIAHGPENKRFYRMSSPNDLEEVMMNLQNAKVPALAIIDNIDGRYRSATANITNVPIFTFIIFERLELGSHDHNETIKRSLKSLLSKIVSKMWKDKISDMDRETKLGLQRLELSNLEYRTIGPLIDNLIGLSITFSLEENENPIFNPNDWLN